MPYEHLTLPRTSPSLVVATLAREGNREFIVHTNETNGNIAQDKDQKLIGFCVKPSGVCLLEPASVRTTVRSSFGAGCTKLDNISPNVIRGSVARLLKREIQLRARRNFSYVVWHPRSLTRRSTVTALGLLPSCLAKLIV